MKRRRQDLSHQVFYAERELARAGIDTDLVDLQALIDVKLTYPENRRLVVLPLLEAKGSRVMAAAERWMAKYNEWKDRV